MDIKKEKPTVEKVGFSFTHRLLHLHFVYFQLLANQITQKWIEMSMSWNGSFLACLFIFKNIVFAAITV